MNRDPRLHRLSSDHHHALTLARRARTAASDPALAPSTWDEVVQRFRTELEPHFQVEEQHLLPALDAAGEDALALQTRQDHAALRASVASTAGTPAERLRSFAALLEAHVRFEERELFEASQDRLPSDVLDAVARASLQNR